jgi:hypothetical protein
MTIMGRFEVQFVADYYVMDVTVDAVTEEMAQFFACRLLREHYGFDPVADHGAQVRIEASWAPPEAWPQA